MKSDPLFLSVDDALAIHQYQVEHFGGDPGLRDESLLQSALGMPCATFDGVFLHSNLHEMAAAYLFHVLTDHPFVDGNKRTGAMAALVFLDINGVPFNAPPSDFTAMVMKVATGRMGKSGIVRFLRKYTATPSKRRG